LLTGFEQNNQLEIFRLNGQLLEANSVEKLQGRVLPSGFYLIRYAGTGTKIYVP